MASRDAGISSMTQANSRAASVAPRFVHTRIAQYERRTPHNPGGDQDSVDARFFAIVTDLVGTPKTQSRSMALTLM